MSSMRCKGSCILKENKSRKCINRYKRGFCVIIPVYNESERVSHLMMEVNEFLLRHKTCEVLISDDGSTDDTANKVIKLGQTNRLKVLKCHHQGKWGALREGFFAARHKDVVFLDADLSVGFDQAKTAVYFLNSMAQVVAGNRYGSMDSEVPLKRKILSRGFAALVKVLANVPILDTQCPMKAITRNEDTCYAVDAMDERGFIGDVEFFILMRDAGVNMANMPVRYVFKQGGFKVVRNTLRMFAGLIRVCWKYAGEPVMLR